MSLYTLADALARAIETEDSLDVARRNGDDGTAAVLLGRLNLQAWFVYGLDKARRPVWPANEVDRGIPSIFDGYRLHTGEWLP